MADKWKTYPVLLGSVREAVVKETKRIRRARTVSSFGNRSQVRALWSGPGSQKRKVRLRRGSFRIEKVINDPLHFQL